MALAAIGDASGNPVANEDIDANIIKSIYSAYDKAKSEASQGTTEGVEKKVVVKDSSENVLGYVYKVSGRHEYGSMTLMVAIDASGKLVDVAIVKNGQTAGTGSPIKNLIDTEYTGGLGLSDIDGIHAVSGATLGSDLVKNLVKAAFAEHNGGAQ